MTDRTSTARPGSDDVPPLTGGVWQLDYLSPDADTQSGGVTDLLNAGELTRLGVAQMLRKWFTGVAVSNIAHASYELGRWVALNGNPGNGFRITTAFTAPRVLIEFTDTGNQEPDPYCFRRDANLAYSVLTPHVVGWGWKMQTTGTRTIRIYGDTTADAPTRGLWFE